MIGRDKIQAVYPLSPLQQGLLFHSLHAPGSGYYIIQKCFVLKGDLDSERFKRAWQRVIDRHAVLRTSFFVGEKMAQIVQRNAIVPLTLEDWTVIPSDDLERRLESYLKEDREKGFDISAAPLMRLRLFKISDGLHYFMWSCHHVLLDAWSITLLLREVTEYYKS